MKNWKIAIKNVLYRPLAATLSVLLFAISVGLLVFLVQMNRQVSTQFEKNLANIDLVIGAKGSRLQMILCNMYHIDAPTGNIDLKAAQPFLRGGHPLIRSAVPLSLGDSYKGYRIVGTNSDFLKQYDVGLASGRMWESPMEVIMGATVARRLKVSLGMEFRSAHGLTDDEDMVHQDAPAFKVVGILRANGSVVDQLVLTPTQSVWMVHDVHDHGTHDHDDHQHEGHDPTAHDDSHEGHQHPPALIPLVEMDPQGREITSLLVQMANRSYQALNFGRNIDENTDLMAANPAIEINRLMSTMGVGMDTIKYLVYLMGVVAFLSVLISLLQSMRSRKYEIAVLKVQGASALDIFWSISLEAVIVAIMGSALGLFLGKFSVGWVGCAMEASYKYSLRAWEWTTADVYIIVVAVFLAFFAAVLPSISAGRMDVHKVLSRR